MLRVIRLEHPKLIASTQNNFCAGKQWFIIDGSRFIERPISTYLKTYMDKWCEEHGYPKGDLYESDFQESLSVIHNKCYLVPVLKPFR